MSRVRIWLQLDLGLGFNVWVRAKFWFRVMVR